MGKKEKKGRKKDEVDDYWETAGETIPSKDDPPKGGDGGGGGGGGAIKQELGAATTTLPVAGKDDDAPATPSTDSIAPTVPVSAKNAKKKSGKKAVDEKKVKGNDGPSSATTAPSAPVATASTAVPPPSSNAGKKKGAGGGGGGAGLAALRARLEARQREEEEARRQEEEERRRIEEEERLEAEAARKKEEDKLRRREREKAKREQLKKEGKLLTDKQKKEKALAEQRLQTMLAAGVTIPGLQERGSDGTGAPRAKKVVYDSKKKRKPQGQAECSGAATEEVKHEETELTEPVEPVDPEEPKIAQPAIPNPNAEVAPADDETSASEEEEELKDSWDAESEGEGDETKQVPASNGVVPKTNGKHAEPPKIEATANGHVRKAASSSEESSDDDSEDDSDSEEELSAVQKQEAKRKAEAAVRRQKAHEAALAAQSRDNLRSPICCILGHVDTGKTKLLDKIRQTNVQEGEAGGITQQIGATYFPMEAIMAKTEVLNKDGTQEYKMPGLLVIDTPGHESFTNLRSRGSSLCNIAILVVDIMHGLEPQTLESMRLLRDRKTPFIVALNKIDRLYGWKATPDGDFRTSLAQQTVAVQREFKNRAQQAILAFAEQSLNAVLYYENKNMGRNVSLVPTSAHTGEGIPDMLMLLVNLTQQRMSDKLMYLSELECTVLEVKMIEGLGTTIDVVLVNGILKEGERIVVCGMEGPIATNIRALVTPQPMRELRIKSAYVHHKQVKASLGVKVVAPGLEKAVAGSRLLVVGPDDDEEELLKDIMSDMTSLDEFLDKSGRGVCVQASTIGSLEALLEFLKQSKIPVAAYNIGPVHRKDIMKCAVMLEKAKEFAVTLCFDVKVDRDAQELADEQGIKLFKADIIYHLFDAFTAYNAEILESKRKDAAPTAVWPCRLKIIACFNKSSPIVLGCDILDGSIRIGTPMCVVRKDEQGVRQIVSLGRVSSLQVSHRPIEIARKKDAAGGVAVKIEHAVYDNAKVFGRHFFESDEVYSMISRASIDTLKATFREEVSKEEWALIVQLKRVLSIQ